ncbi:hypothetical protein OCU04_011393 [Sclerotinia nivalis]|uniref:Heterokaryon incompatibility domain-containing protein n=1 Tax=Sclerotinia nivalis TaxID=352851 RepID=A0A9X0ACN9_9HELO|nr:hypothetical protein OCU04_011393 [Sclerotinia nivalis]
MELARRLGIRYLWVDTLCIVQDDQQERSRQISLMGNIYNNSTLTIAAAAGKNPHAGLYGISPRAGRPIEKYRIKDPDESMFLTLSLCLPSLCQEVRKSKWYTRGWTYQEQCLSQRCIYFTTDEIFFQCPEVQWREGYDYGEQLVPFQDLRIRTGPPWWSKRLRKDPDPTPYHYLWDVTMRQQAESYQRAVREYTRRSLTSPHDVLHAFEGIFNRFNRQENASDLDIRRTQGIPVHLLLQAILWFPSNSCQRRLCNDKQITGVVEQFSTWSWASWDGPIEFIFAESLWLSRSISHAPRRNVPLHICIPWWQFGDSMRKVWTNSSWKAVGENHHKSPGHFPDDFLHSQQYLSDHIGVDIVQLVNHSITLHQSMPRCGQLRFVAPYFGSGKFVLSGAVDKSIRVVTLCGVYCGEFQFDGQTIKPVDELVLVLCTNTLNKIPKKVGVFLGLATHNGLSVRAGIGFVYFAQDAKVTKPPIEYKLFTIQ